MRLTRQGMELAMPAWSELAIDPWLTMAPSRARQRWKPAWLRSRRWDPVALIREVGLLSIEWLIRLKSTSPHPANDRSKPAWGVSDQYRPGNPAQQS